MATNIRLPEELAGQLRQLSERLHRSQASLIREAVENLIADYGTSAGRARGPVNGIELIPPKYPYRRSTVEYRLPEGVNSLDLLDRDDRF